MVATEGDPIPKRLLADNEMTILPSPVLSEQGSGLMEGTVQSPFTQDDAEIVREEQMSPVLESV